GQSATQHGAHARPSPDPSPLSLHDALPILAHNPHAAAVLAQNLDNMGFHPYTYAVVGMLNDKDIDGVIAKLSSRIDHWYCAALPGARGGSGEALASHVSAALRNAPAADEAPTVQTYPDPAAAYAAARARAGEGDRLVLFGSFLTVASVLQSLGRKP